MAEPQEQTFIENFVQPQNGDGLDGACSHYWKITADTGGEAQWEGICIKCGEGRTFRHLEPVFQTKIPCSRCGKGFLHAKSDSLIGNYYQCSRCKATYL